MTTQPDGASARTDSSAPLVISRRTGPLLLALAALIVLIGLVGWWGVRTESSFGSGFAIGVTGVLGLMVVLAGFELFRAGKPLLVADDEVLTTGPTPSVRLRWDEIASIRVLRDRGSRGPAIGVVPLDLADAVTRSLPNPRNASQIVSMLRKRESSQGAPIVVSLKLTGLDPVDVGRRLSELAAGRTTVTD